MIELEPWHDLFVMTGGAAAALAGLLFVAVSLNFEQVLQYRALPNLAAQSVALLVGLVLLSVLALAPGQPGEAFAVEVLVLGLVTGVIAVVPTARSLSELTERRWRVGRLAMALIAAAPLIVAGVVLVAAVPGGLYWLLGAIVAIFVIATYNAWILLIEIRR